MSLDCICKDFLINDNGVWNNGFFPIITWLQLFIHFTEQLFRSTHKLLGNAKFSFCIHVLTPDGDEIIIDQEDMSDNEWFIPLRQTTRLKSQISSLCFTVFPFLTVCNKFHEPQVTTMLVYDGSRIACPSCSREGSGVANISRKKTPMNLQFGQ